MRRLAAGGAGPNVKVPSHRVVDGGVVDNGVVDGGVVDGCLAHDGKVFVEKREWTRARCDLYSGCCHAYATSVSLWRAIVRCAPTAARRAQRCLHAGCNWLCAWRLLRPTVRALSLTALVRPLQTQDRVRLTVGQGEVRLRLVRPLTWRSLK